MTDTAIVICVIWVSLMAVIGWALYLVKRYPDKP